MSNICTKCQNPIDSGWQRCPACGADIHATSRPVAQDELPQWVRIWQKTVVTAKRWWANIQRYLFQDPNQLWWDITARLGGGVFGVFWLIYSWYRQVLQHGWQTAVLIVAVPMALTYGRKKIDGWLAPLQVHRQKLPRWSLVVIAIIAPLGITAVLIQVGARWLGIHEERCVQLAIVLGTAIGHAVLRDPEPDSNKKAPSAVPQTRRTMS